MAICDRCGVDDELSCSGCGEPGHSMCRGECCEDGEEYGDVCDRCWAELSHVEGVLSCAFGCTCLADFPDLAEED